MSLDSFLMDEGLAQSRALSIFPLSIREHLAGISYVVASFCAVIEYVVMAFVFIGFGLLWSYLEVRK